METTGHFTGGKQTVDRLAIGVHHMRVSIDQNTAHEIVCTYTEVVSIQGAIQRIQIEVAAKPGVCTGGAVGIPLYTYYKCAAAKKKKTCDKKAVRKQWLEDLVVSETMKLVEDDASMNAIIAKVMELQNQESTDLPIYEKQLRETEVGITNMLNAIQMGILTNSTKERLEALEEQRKELQARIAEERLAKPKMKEEFVRFWLLRFRKLDMTQPEQRQALVDTFINAIYLYDDKVLITFNYKEGTETVAFGEAVKAEKSSDMSARGAPIKER